jgi:glycosyltransferase involved in cell wall biosynthesis
MAKIIQITTFFHPVIGGVEQHVLELSKELVKKGHQVTIFCSDSTRTKKRIKKLEQNIGKIKIFRFKTLISISQFYKIYPGLFFKLFKSDYDIVHVHGFRKLEVYIALLVSKLKNKKVIVTTHNPFPTTDRSKLLQLFVNFHDITIGKVLCRYIDRIICLNKSEIKYLKQFNIKEKNISIIPNGISDYSFLEGDKRKFIRKYHIPVKKYKYKVLWIGRLNKVKGLENLEIAVKQLKNTLFVFAGPNDNYTREYKSLYKKCPNVLFTGPIKHRDTIHAYKMADLFVLPSIHEPFGIVLIEAMAQRLPIVSTNIGGTLYIIKEKFGILLNPYEQWGWLISIKKLLYNRPLRKQMGNFARKEAENYRWSNLSEEIINIYKSLLK